MGKGASLGPRLGGWKPRAVVASDGVPCGCLTEQRPDVEERERAPVGERAQLHPRGVRSATQEAPPPGPQHPAQGPPPDTATLS